MSNPPTAPEYAAPTALVRNEQGHEISRDVDHGTPLRRIATPSRANTSTSLLSKLFAETQEGGPSDTLAEPGKTINNGGVNTNGGYQFAHQSGSRSMGSSPPTSTMASAMAVPASIAPSFSLGPSPISMSPPEIDFRNMSDFMNHLEFHSSNRPRGTSLERTQKEMRTSMVPLDTSSTNPGDTGMSHPPTPNSPSVLSAITNNEPTDGVRARYRLWRHARTEAPEKTWSIGGNGADSAAEGQVEKSIADAMAGVEPNNRSRKASHSLRFFKEGLPEEKHKKKDPKDRGRSKGRSPLMEDLGQAISGYFDAGDRIAQSPTTLGSTAPQPPSRTVSGNSITTSRSGHPHSMVDESAVRDTGSPEDVHYQRHTLPQQLLDDLCKRHELSPAPRKTRSYTQARASTGELTPPQEVSSPEICAQDGQELHTTKSNSEEDEDSEKEQLFSATFVLHQASHEEKELDTQDSPKISQPHISGEWNDGTKPEQWLVEHEVQPRNKDVFSPLDPEKDVLKSVVRNGTTDGRDAGYTSEGQHTTESEYDSVSEAGYTTRGDDNLDGLDNTPTGTHKPGHHMMKNQEDHIHRHQKTAKEPPAAIALVPYHHQVGGHTTVWSFSKHAVCKPMNNRENEFYEKIEHDHPKLLKFMPRYIGVLNVTFAKQQKRKPDAKETVSAGSETIKDETHGPSALQDVSAGQPPVPMPGDKAPEPQQEGRVISQSISNNFTTAPTVTFADNRHIIPKSLLMQSPAHFYNLHNGLENGHANGDSPYARSQSQPPLPHDDSTFRPTPKHAASWGATRVNRDLKDEVFGEVFGSQVSVQKHKKPGHQRRGLLHRPGKPSTLRVSNSESCLVVPEAKLLNGALTSSEGTVKREVKATENPDPPASSPLNSPGADGDSLSKDGMKLVDDGSAAGFGEQAGTSAPEPEITNVDSSKGKRQRRYSSGGLRRKPEEVQAGRGDLKYFQEADDPGYRGDGEDNVFRMDSERINKASAAAPKIQGAETAEERATQQVPDASVNGTGSEPAPPAPREPEAEGQLLDRPANPNVARTQPDQRVEFFLLLEDIAMGMKRPCVMDLKMGTRQYGIDATEKKQMSQRAKCAGSTSKELGVRVCGLQVWNVPSQEYLFKDKYYGRDLKAGREFQDALTRFLYDGADYASVLRHIPTILRKLEQLELLISGLNGYRFYAASLLLIYDGGIYDEGFNKDARSFDMAPTIPRPVSEHDFKIKMVDFANCVIPDRPNFKEELCPPRHPGTPDKGFLRGLRSLQTYFRKIQKDITEQESMIIDRQDDFDLDELSF